MDKKNILLLSFWYPNKHKPSFGIFIKRHAQAINRNHNVVVLSLNIVKGDLLFKKSVERFEDEKNLVTHQVTLESSFYKLLYVMLPVHFMILRVYIKKHIEPGFPIGIIHSNILFPCSLVGHRLARAFNCGHIISEHWSKVDLFFKKNIYAPWGKKSLNTADAITCVSERLAETVKKHTTNRSVTEVPNIIDEEHFYFDPSAQKNKILTFIAVAHWTKPKDPFLFMDALEELKYEKMLDEFQLTMVGTGPLRDEINNRKYSFKMAFIDKLEPAQLGKELNRSHFFLHGSHQETFSVVIAEALSCGLPCITSPVGIAPEVLNDTNGAIADYTIEDWKVKILTCLARIYDHAAISAQIRGKYSEETVGKLFDEVYLKVG